YYLEFVPPSGYTFSPAYQEDFPFDSNADPADGRTAVFTLTAGEVNPYYDAGLNSAFATIIGRTWNDADSDGIQDGGETGLAGAWVFLFNQSGTLVSSTITDSNGGYTFAAVAPGAH